MAVGGLAWSLAGLRAGLLTARLTLADAGPPTVISGYLGALLLSTALSGVGLRLILKNRSG
jgi:hypothetical protein